MQYRNYKVVYRRYAGLFFCVCIDANDNELAYLEAIHLFVEVLGEWTILTKRQGLLCLLGPDQHRSFTNQDSFFGNVCELDLVFNFYKVRKAMYS